MSEASPVTVSQQFTGYFYVDDNLGSNSGYYTTLQLSNFSGQSLSGTINNTDVQWRASSLAVISGVVNPNVELLSGWTAYSIASGTTTFIQRNS